MSELKTTHKWEDINWRKLERKVYKLQKRIYQATARNEITLVKKLQRLLTKSWYAKLLAVRRVTQENRGRKSAGVDGIKSLNPIQRLKLAQELKTQGKAKPTRRVWIPKPGKEEKRPLGIPVMYDRALQALVKMAIEPQWEALFESNSYGFRPGKSCQDAIIQIWQCTRRLPKWVLDADIAQCFDKINHEALLNKVQAPPYLRRQLKAWLKSGVMDNLKYFDTEEGTPQGGVISPLLANIALHGLETQVIKAFNGKYFLSPLGKKKYYSSNPVSVIRYADDFLILHEDLGTIQKAKDIVTEWLESIGLELKPSKTRIAHTLYQVEEHEKGFDFLGFHIEQRYRSKKYRCNEKNGKSNRLGENFITLITASKKGIEKHLNKVRNLILEKGGKAKPQRKLISELNPIIRGWANYYRIGNCSDQFSKIDHLIFEKLLQWGKHRHPHKSMKWIKNRYWGNTFSTFKDRKIGAELLKHSEIKIISPGTKNQYIKVKGERSPYDGDFIYWSTRMGQHPEITTRVSKLLKKQEGKCSHCQMYFKDKDILEVHHQDGNHKNNQEDNLTLVHGICHDRIHGNKNKSYEVVV